MFLILADSAQVVDGKLYMLGGAWNRVTVDTLPADRSCSIAIGLHLAATGLGPRHNLRIALVAPGESAERELGRGEFGLKGSPEIPEDIGQRIVAAFPIVLHTQQTGYFAVRLYVNGSNMGEVPFELMQQPQ